MKNPKSAPTNGHCLFLLLLLFASSCAQPQLGSSNIADRELILEAVLAAEASAWPASRVPPCVETKSTAEPETDSRQVALVPLRVLPQRFVLCSSSPSFYYLSLEEPRIRGKVAYVSLAFQCGNLCGHGTDYLLERTLAGWNVILRSRSWIS